MKDERIEEFMEHLEFDDKIIMYKNKEKGLAYPLTAPYLLCRVDKLELDSCKQPAGQLEKAIFEGKVEDKKYIMHDLERLIPKSDITKNKEDMFTMTTKKTKGAIIYNVSNQCGIFNSYENVDEAFKLFDEINSKIKEYL